MPEESREERSSGAAEKREPRAVQQRRPDEPQTGDRTAPRPFPERRPPQRQGSEEERRTRDEWKSYARLKLGVSPHAVAGALAHHDPAEEIGEADVRKALDEFSVRRGAE